MSYLKLVKYINIEVRFENGEGGECISLKTRFDRIPLVKSSNPDVLLHF
jgi:hypothetical protein